MCVVVIVGYFCSKKIRQIVTNILKKKLVIGINNVYKKGDFK